MEPWDDLRWGQVTEEVVQELSEDQWAGSNN